MVQQGFSWLQWRVISLICMGSESAFQGMHYSGGLDFSENSCPWLHLIIETTLRKEATSLSTTDCCPKACPGPHPPSLVLVGPPSLESAASTSLGAEVVQSQPISFASMILHMAKGSDIIKPLLCLQYPHLKSSSNNFQMSR